MRPLSHNSGFTLLEGLIASVILSMSIIGIVVPFTAGAQNEREDGRRTLAIKLAQEMMEEVIAHSFNDGGTDLAMGHEAGEVRGTYDSLNDYDGYTETNGQIKDSAGNVIADPAAAGMTRTVSVSYVYMAGQSHLKPANFASVVVTVAYGNVTLASVSRLVYSGTP